MVQTPSHPPAIPAVAVTVSMPSARSRQAKKKTEEKVTATGSDKGQVEQARSGHCGTRVGPKPRRTAARAPQGSVGIALTGAQGKDVKKKRRSEKVERTEGMEQYLTLCRRCVIAIRSATPSPPFPLSISHERKNLAQKQPAVLALTQGLECPTSVGSPEPMMGQWEGRW